METKSLLNQSADPICLMIEPNQAGQRIDKFLSQALPSYSRSYFQNLIDSGCVTINMHPAKSSSHVKAGDCINITLPAEQKKPLYTPITSDLGIEILFIHEHFFIINKPANLLVHQTEMPTSDPTLVDWLLSNHHELIEVGSIERPGIVHRLDRETSGLLVIARTNYAHKIFSEMFKKRSISKSYIALVQGHPSASGSIDLSIGRHPINRKKMTTFIPDDHALATTKTTAKRNQSSIRNAITHYTVKKYFADCSLIEVYPVTGRTHQIRVHCAAIGHPLVGDFLYGTPSKLIDRHALHASSLSFTFDNTPFHFQKEIPDDFKRLISFLEN
jgi:23S rRNA pseudouridine1911/1915/1917 synthase